MTSASSRSDRRLVVATRFRRVIALVTPDGTERIVESTAEGVITRAPRPLLTEAS